MLAAQIEQAPAAPRVRIFEEALSLGRDVSEDIRVLRVPPGMAARQALVRDRGDGTALVFWAGWRPEGDPSCTGRVCEFFTLRTLVLLHRIAEILGEEPAPLRALVPGADGGPIWFVADVLGGAS